MALLRPKAGLALGGLLAASIAGCIVLEQLGVLETPLRFSHALHADEGLGCGDCHGGAAEGEEPAMPSTQQCAVCHEGGDAEKPAERRVASLFDETGALAGARAAQLPPDVRFDHGEHVDLGLDCSVCHRGIETSQMVDADLAVPMSECQRCHAGTGAADTCATCHAEIRTDRAPPNHAPGWILQHGAAARAGWEPDVVGAAANDCALCHSESSCAACHEVEKPRSHNGLWRLKAHGVAAGMDRETCTTCHRPDFCERCHEETPPLNHQGAWGGPLDTHCLTCHFPLKSENCFTCHTSAPSHFAATPLPGDHLPGMNCLQCHGSTASLPHVDKGDSCIACHN